MAQELVCLLAKGMTIRLFARLYANLTRPIYIAEMSPANMRGRLIAMQQWMITWGVCISAYASFPRLV